MFGITNPVEEPFVSRLASDVLQRLAKSSSWTCLQSTLATVDVTGETSDRLHDLLPSVRVTTRR